MSRALSVVLAILCPLGAAAQPAPRRRTHVTPPGSAPADIQSFEQTFEFVLLQAGQAYLKDQAMPDPTALDPFLTPLKEPQLAKAKANRQRLEEVITSAEWVQNGASSVKPEIYKLMVDQAADDLGVGSIVEQDFLPNARAGRSEDASEKALSHACQTEARNQSFDRRAFYESCLGHHKAEEVYLNPQRHPSGQGQQSQDPAAVRLLNEIGTHQSRLASDISRNVDQTFQNTSRALTAGSPSTDDTTTPKPSVVRPGPSGFQNIAPRAPGQGANSFTQPDGLKTNEPPLSAADLAAGSKLASVVAADEIGFTGYCYSYVKSALHKVGIVDKATIAATGDGGRAAQFNDFVQKNPALLKRKLLRIPSPSWPLPIGTIVVWSPSACHYDAKSGHIEIVTRIKPPQACSDGCQTFQTACLNELAADPARAAQELPQAQSDLDQAQAAAKDPAASAGGRRQAAIALPNKKAAVKKIQSRLEPRVAAYVVQR